VADAECIRHTVLGADTKWTLLGQSFGGFCITRYLCASPNGVREALYTGGLPPLIRHPGNAALGTYGKLLERIKTQNVKYYKRFPGDVGSVRGIAEFLREKGPQQTPNGYVFPVYHIPPTDCPYTTDTFFFISGRGYHYEASKRWGFQT
jgi:hypothetical protein